MAPMLGQCDGGGATVSRSGKSDRWNNPQSYPQQYPPGFPLALWLLLRVITQGPAGYRSCQVNAPGMVVRARWGRKFCSVCRGRFGGWTSAVPAGATLTYPASVASSGSSGVVRAARGGRRAGRQARRGVTRGASAIARAASGPVVHRVQRLTAARGCEGLLCVHLLQEAEEVSFRRRILTPSGRDRRLRGPEPWHRRSGRRGAPSRRR
jgi:hypothetical protein